MPLAEGTKFDDFEILGPLGAGGMGEVYRARDAVLNREVAIKVLPAVFSQDPDLLRRFAQEAQSAAALNHPNIVAIYRFGTYAGSPYLVSELLKGETLGQLMRRGQLPVRKIIDFGIQIARGLSAAHEKGIVHRDLKPDNLFLTSDGQVKILDFGLAKLTQPQHGAMDIAETVIDRSGASAKTEISDKTELGVVMGTLGYMAPEQVRGSGIDQRADLFALGAVLYEMLTGRRAFKHPTAVETMTAILNEEPPSIAQIAPSVPPGIQRVVNRCLEKRPEQRFQTASDLAFALESLSDSGRTQAVAAIPQHSASKKPTWIGLAGALALILLAAAGYWYSKQQAKPVFEHFSILKAMDSEHVSMTAISPDGMYLASVVEDPKRAESLTLRQIPTNTEKVILNDPKFSGFASVMFSPDGGYIYFRISALGDPPPDRVDMYRIPVLGGTPERVVLGVDAPPSFVEGGQRLCFYRENVAGRSFQFLSASAEGGDEKVLGTGSTVGFVDAACDPTAKHAVLEDELGKVEAFDFASGKRRVLISMASLGGYLTDLRWEPHGSGLFVIGRKVPNFVGQLGFLSYPGGELRQITNDLSSYAGISLTSNGKTIATRQTDSNGRLAVLSIDKPSSVEEHGPRGLRFFSWLDNGKILASDEVSALRMIDLASDETTTLHVISQHWFLEPAPCGPDAIVSVGGTLNQSAMQIYKMNRDGSMATPVTSGPYDVYPSCTPDGKFLFYADNHDHDHPQIQRIPMAGGGTQSAAKGMRYNLSPDGKLLAEVHLGGTPHVQVIAADTNKKLQNLPLPADFFFFAAFSADGKSIFFTTKTGSDSAVWKQSLDSNTPVKIASLPGKTVRWIRSSPDGTKLGLILDTPQSEAVLLRETQ